MYRWNKADVFKQDENGESYGAFGMLLRDVGVTPDEFTKHQVPQLVAQNIWDYAFDKQCPSHRLKGNDLRIKKSGRIEA